MLLSTIILVNLFQLRKTKKQTENMKIQIEKNGADFKVLIPALICGENESIIIAPEDIKEMRDWVSECSWADDCETEEFSDEQIIRGINRFYDGGLIQFQRDSGKVALQAA